MKSEMNRIAVFLVIFYIVFQGCKKKDEPSAQPAPEPVPVQHGDLIIKVVTYDTLGEPLSDHGNVKVALHTGQTATTSSSGEVKFSGLEYGTYAPSLLRSGYDGPPQTVTLNDKVSQAELPFPQHSTYKLSNLDCQVVTHDSITIYFKLDKPVPPGKTCKIAIITNTSSPVTASNYTSVDIISISTGTVNGINIAKGNLKTFTGTLASGSAFYVSALPVSYGLFASNITVKTNILGESLTSPGSIQLLKNW
jgi:hypothetical protein